MIEEGTLGSLTMTPSASTITSLVIAFVHGIDIAFSSGWKELLADLWSCVIM